MDYIVFYLLLGRRTLDSYMYLTVKINIAWEKKRWILFRVDVMEKDVFNTFHLVVMLET